MCVYMCVRVCVTPNHFNQSNSTRYDTSPLYSSICTAAMFGLSVHCSLVCDAQFFEIMLKLQGSTPKTYY